ncbi:MAG: sodium-independent anion transporter, partial [Bacteroidetes bacterium]
GLHNLIETLKILRKEKIIVILSGVNSETEKEFADTNIYDLVSKDLICDNFNDSLKLAKELL